MIRGCMYQVYIWSSEWLLSEGCGCRSVVLKKPTWSVQCLSIPCSCVETFVMMARYSPGDYTMACIYIYIYLITVICLGYAQMRHARSGSIYTVRACALRDTEWFVGSLRCSCNGRFKSRGSVILCTRGCNCCSENEKSVRRDITK